MISNYTYNTKYWPYQFLNALKFQAIYFTQATNFMWFSEECLNRVTFRKHALRLKRIKSPLCIQHQRQKIDWCVLLNFFLKLRSCLLLFIFLNKTQFNKGLILQSKSKTALTVLWRKIDTLQTSCSRYFPNPQTDSGKYKAQKSRDCSLTHEWTILLLSVRTLTELSDPTPDFILVCCGRALNLSFTHI